MIEKDGDYGMCSTRVYKIFKETIGEESALIDEPLQADAQNDDLPE